MKGRIFEGGPSGQGSSDWASWFYCPFKAYASEHSLGGKDSSEALDLGSAVHQVEAHHYLRLKARQEGRDPDEWLPPLEAVPAAIAKGVLNPLTPAALASIEPIYLSCHNPNQTQGKRVVEVEAVMPIELGKLYYPGHPKHGQPIRYAPRVDLVEEDSQGIWMVDHKKAARPSQATIEAYSNHMQFILLAAIGHAYYGEKFRGVKLHLIKSEPPYGHDWLDLGITKFQVEAMSHNFHYVAHQRASLELAVLRGDLNPLHIPRAVNEQVCQGRYSQCSVFHYCKNGAQKAALKAPSFVRKARR